VVIAEPNSRCAVRPSEVSLPSKLPITTWPTRSPPPGKRPRLGFLSGHWLSAGSSPALHRKACHLQFFKILEGKSCAYEVSGNRLILVAVTSRSGDNSRAAPAFFSGRKEPQFASRRALIRRDVHCPRRRLKERPYNLPSARSKRPVTLGCDRVPRRETALSMSPSLEASPSNRSRLSPELSRYSPQLSIRCAQEIPIR